MCYNESNGDQLEAFTEELEKEGKMTEDTKVLMKEITEKKPAEKSAQTSNIRVSAHRRPGDCSLYVGDSPCVLGCEPHGNLEVRGYESSNTETKLGFQKGHFLCLFNLHFRLNFMQFAKERII